MRDTLPIYFGATTGSHVSLPHRAVPVTVGRSTQHHTMCRYCAAVCGVIVTTLDGRITDVSGDGDHPISRGYICTKGRRIGAAHEHEGRLTHAELGRRADRRAVPLHDMLDDLGNELSAIVGQHGGQAIGVYAGSGGYVEYGMLALAHSLLAQLGSGQFYAAFSVDVIARPVVSNLMSGAPLTPFPDWDDVGLLLLFGTNVVVSHGHDYSVPDPISKMRAIRSRGGEVWVIDPRASETSYHADRHLAVRPGSDAALLAFLVRELLVHGADEDYLRDHATGVERLSVAVEPFTVDRASEWTGLTRETLDDLVTAIRRRGRIAARAGTGITMSASPCVAEWLVWCLNIVTGSYERKGGLWFNKDVFAQLDKMTYPSPISRPGPGPTTRPQLSSWIGQYPCAAMADEIEAGNLRALLVFGGNPVLSIPDTPRVTRALEQLEVLAVADVTRTVTTDLATHVLPAANTLEFSSLNFPFLTPMSFGQYAPAVFEPEGDRKPQWWYTAQLARRLGLMVLPGGLDPDNCTDDDLNRVLTEGARVTFDELVASPSGVLIDEPLEPWVQRVVLPDGRWQLACEPIIAQLAQLEPPPPLALIPRRQPRHLNSMLVGVGTTSRPDNFDEPDVLVNARDARAAGVRNAHTVVVTSATGSLRGQAHVTDAIAPGAISVPHGWGDPRVNQLTSSADDVDPLSGMPRLSGVAVTIAPDSST